MIDIDRKKPTLRIKEDGSLNIEDFITPNGDWVRGVDPEQQELIMRILMSQTRRCSRCGKALGKKEGVKRTVNHTDWTNPRVKYRGHSERLYVDEVKSERNYILCDECEKKKENVGCIVVCIGVVSAIIAYFLANYISDNARQLIDDPDFTPLLASAGGEFMLFVIIGLILGYPISVFIMLKTKTHSSQLTGEGWKINRIVSE